MRSKRFSITTCLLALSVFSTAWAGEPVFTQVDVFTAGEGGYFTFRIPALVTAPDGTLIAFAEARRDNRHDPGGGDIDLVCKRSTDHGKGWSALMVLDDPGEKWAAANPTPVVDRSNGRTWIIYNRWEPGRGTINAEPGTTHNKTWARSSDDHGQTWSEAQDITQGARDVEDWGMMFSGSGGAIQSRSGRLLIPAAMQYDTSKIWVSVGDFEGRLNFMRSYVVYSDDHGASWQRGELLHTLSDENQLVELADGAIMMDARQSSGAHRWVAISRDGGKTWSRPRPGQNVTPVATSIERYTLRADGDDRDRILWTGPTGPGRKSLVVRVSYDEAQTFANEKVIYGGLAAYSDISILKDKTVGVLWERGLSENYQFIAFTHFNLDFLESGVSIPPSFP